MKRFILNRLEDTSGVSDVGIVAEGVLWDNGLVTVAWRPPFCSVSAYPSMNEVERVHGHNGQTVIEWLDEPYPSTRWDANGERWYFSDEVANIRPVILCTGCGLPVYEGYGKQSENILLERREGSPYTHIVEQEENLAIFNQTMFYCIRCMRARCSVSMP